MAISRRTLLQRLAAGAVAGAAAKSFTGIAFAEEVAPPGAAVIVEPLLLYRNENPYGPSEKVLAVMREACSCGNRYPRNEEYDSLLNKIAAMHGVKPEQIVLGCGSSEILRLSATTFLGPQKKLVEAAPTFPLLGKLAQAAGAEVIDVPLNTKFEHDLDGMLARADTSAGLVYVCNPNNPTGTITPRKDIEAFIRKLPAKSTVLIDEAYHHFAGDTPDYVSFLDRPIDDNRVIVARTFSKIYGLAGMRVGYAVAPPDVARRLSADRMQFAVSVISARAASAALDDSDYVRMGVKRNAADRREFMSQANARKLRPIDSHTNFLMLDPGRPPQEVVDHLKKNNILIGPIYPAMDKYIRVSLGTPSEMQIFWSAWDLMPARKMAM